MPPRQRRPVGNPVRSEPWERRARRFVSSLAVASGRRTLLVGVSGGPDSVCLLHLLSRSRDKLPFDLHAAHLDHGLRGKESEADRDYVVRLCQELDIVLTTERADLEAFKRPHSPIEEVAREARYNFFSRVAAETSACGVAVGHTADDQLETILLHLIRGAGSGGLRGMDKVSIWHGLEQRIDVVRPLLEVRRSQTEGYCLKFGLNPRMDATNMLPRHLRNRVRMELLPLLRDLNPGFDDVLLRNAANAREDYCALEHFADAAWPKVSQLKDGVLHLDRQRLLAYPRGIQRLLLRRAVQHFSGSPKGTYAAHADLLVGALQAGPGKTFELPEGLKARTTYEEIILGGPEENPYPALQGEHPVVVPGETSIPQWKVTATICRITGVPEDVVADPLCALLDLRGATPSLIVRSRREGDRFQPLGMAQPKKLQDFLVDEKVPREWRDGIPLVCREKEVVWVVGYRVSEQTRVTPGTENVLNLRFKRA